MRLRERFQTISTVNTIDVILPVLISLFFFYVFFLDKRLAVLLVLPIFRAMKNLVGRHVISFIILLMSAVMFIMMMSF